jgi:density-regulated protein DRP1
MNDKGKKRKDETELIQKETENLQIEEKKTNLPQGKVIKYCSVCTFPEEYCEYSHDLLKKRKELPINADVAQTQPTEQQPVLEGEQKKEEEKKTEQPKVEEEKKETKEKKHKKITDKIHIKNSKRSKRKAVTVIKNIEKFGLDLKEVGKMLSKKFACSSTVNKDEENKDAIFMTGEFEDDLKDFLMEKFKTLKDEHFHIDRIKKKDQGQGAQDQDDD